MLSPNADLDVLAEMELDKLYITVENSRNSVCFALFHSFDCLCALRRLIIIREERAKILIQIKKNGICNVTLICC